MIAQATVNFGEIWILATNNNFAGFYQMVDLFANELSYLNCRINGKQ